MKISAVAVSFWWAALSYAGPAQQCPPPQGVALQVLGSGGPIADDARASSAYLVWVDGKSRVLIDSGGGAFLRFGEAQANFSELEFIGLSHFHTDHSADFPALLKSGYLSGYLDQNLAAVQSRYSGPIMVANDLQCIPLTP